MDRHRRLIFEDDIQCVDDTRNVTQYRQQDVDQEVPAATALKENS